MLRDFYYQDDRWLDGALLSIEEAGETEVGLELYYRETTELTCISSFKHAQERLALWQHAVKDLGQDKERSFEHKVGKGWNKARTLRPLIVYDVHCRWPKSPFACSTFRNRWSGNSNTSMPFPGSRLTQPCPISYESASENERRKYAAIGECRTKGWPGTSLRHRFKSS